MRCMTWLSNVSWVASCMMVAACGDDSTAPSQAASQFWGVTTNAHAITLSSASPYDTIQLVVTPLDAQHTPLIGAPPAKFTVLAGNHEITVSTTGLVRALQATQAGDPARILVQQTVDNVTLTDTVLVQVTDTTRPLARLTMRLPAGISNRLPVVDYRDGVGVIVEGFDTQGDSIPGLLYDLRSSDLKTAFTSFDGVATDAQWVFSWRNLGPVRATATATVYGVTKTASLDLVGVPAIRKAIVLRSRTPKDSRTPVAFTNVSQVELSAGAIVEFTSEAGVPVDLVFDDSTNVEAVPPSLSQYTYVATLQLFGAFLGWDLGAGNIPPIHPADSAHNQPKAVRYFPRPKTYHFHSPRYPTLTGTLVVHPL